MNAKKIASPIAPTKTKTPTATKPGKVFNVAIHSYKGGVAKTTLAYHLSDALVMRHFNVALLDLDPQGSTTALSEANDEAFEAGETTEKGFLFDLYAYDEAFGASAVQWKNTMANLSGAGHTLVVSEYGPGIPGNVLGQRHDLVLIPFQPCRTDFKAALKGLATLRQGQKVLPVLTRYKQHSPSHRVFYELAEDRFGKGNVLVMPEATVFQTCNNLGRSVYTIAKTERLEGQPRPSKEALTKAQDVMNVMADRVLTELGLNLDFS